MSGIVTEEPHISISHVRKVTQDVEALTVKSTSKDMSTIADGSERMTTQIQIFAKPDSLTLKCYARVHQVCKSFEFAATRESEYRVCRFIPMTV